VARAAQAIAGFREGASVNRPSGHAIWTIPIALGVLTGIGLVAGLVADDLWDAVSWVGLGMPLAVIFWCVWVAPRGRQTRRVDAGHSLR
jgi:hypothetical protein